MYKARPVNPERVFVHAPLQMALGSNHVAYISDYLAHFEGKLSLKKKKIVKIDDIFKDQECHKKVE